MDQSRVAEIWVEAGRRIGTGYLLTNRLVLTSYHVVQALRPGDRAEVRPLQIPQRSSWLAATMCWPDEPVDVDATPERDAALLSIDDPPGFDQHLVGAVRFGQVRGQDRIACLGLGFPDAEARPDRRRDTMPVRGHIDTLQALRSGMLTIHVDEGIVPRRMPVGSRWAGSSGTAIFCGPLLVGVLAADRAIADDAGVLAAAPLTALAGSAGFRETLAAHGVTVELEHAGPAVRRLDAYLDGAHAVGARHPHGGLLPLSLPSLEAVYRPQRLSLRPPRDNTASAGSRAHMQDRPAGLLVDVSPGVPLPAGQILADPQTCVIVAEAGGGKSSLLRTRLAQGITAWRDGSDERRLPVLVPASALAGRPLAEAIADAITADLGFVVGLDPTVFTTEPRPGARWLVLVDGLDEVGDRLARADILRRIALAMSGEHARLHTFVIATRPLPDGELNVLGQTVPWYDLLPFEERDVADMAEHWFTAARAPDPKPAAQRFLRALEDGRLTDLARTPLIAAMLCQLHVDDPTRPLPSGRSQLYGGFVELLWRPPARVTELAARYPGLDRYGPEVHSRAEGVLSSVVEVIAHLAWQRRLGSTRPAVDVAEEAPAGVAVRPAGVGSRDWSVFLDDVLRRTGLFIGADGDLQFTHQTVVEYFAAQHAVRHLGAKAVSAALGSELPTRPRRWPVWRALRANGNRPPTTDASYVGFLLDAAAEAGMSAGAKRVERLAAEGTLEALRFLAALARLRTRLSEPVVVVAAARLADFTRRHDRSIEAAVALAAFDADLAADLLHARALDSTLDRRDTSWERVTERRRLAAAKALIDIDRTRAADLLCTLALDVYVNGREEAAKTLVALGDPRAADMLFTVAGNYTPDGRDRVYAAKMLLAIGDPRAADLLHAIALDGSVARLFGDRVRIEAAEVLGTVDPARAAGILADLRGSPQVMPRDTDADGEPSDRPAV
ncbi:NACHT domain-containing protein [Catellatospora citrea]|uniref:NACHT domain-containing protein n=1 Tax=Catellatospora citrea TaxID=53366 RepID=A0A8J3P1J1_9ACTN|nr:NACHT domain-containing protein [Catellatospora citrea]RKE05463.1 NACHT domain-containing protein [Catellatospora citrea]GIG00137.1 hypothetical protein Cci01nite_52300 [Catellatospora citrea]